MDVMVRLLVIALVLLVHPATADDLIVAGLGDQAPLAVLAEDGTLEGLEPALVEALCERMDQACHPRAAASWQDLVQGLRDGRYDVGFGALSRRTVEALGIEASTPWLTLDARFVVTGDSDGPDDPLASPDAIIGVLRGTPHALWLEARLPAERLRRYADAEEMYLSLKAGSVDALFGDALSLWRDLVAAEEPGAWVFAGPSQVVDEDALVLALFATVDRDAVNDALRVMAADGTLDALLDRFLPGLAGP